MSDVRGNEQQLYAENDDLNSRLFFALTENLKLPLLQIARQAELAYETDDLMSLKDIQYIADTTTQLVDSYILSTRLCQAGENLVLTPVSLSAMLSDVAHRLEKIALANSCDIELHIAGRYGPIMAHPSGLSAALINIGQVFIDAQSQRTIAKRPVIKLAAHRTKNGISAGLFSDIEGLNRDMFSRAKKLYGNSPQPLSQLTAHNGAGVFIADSLLGTMSSGLRIAHHQKLTGLAATFTPSYQMALV